MAVGLTGVDVGAQMTALDKYIWKSVTGSATLTGFFTDYGGNQLTPLASITIPEDDTATFEDATYVNDYALHDSGDAMAVPATACGFHGTLDADVWQGLSNDFITEEPQVGYPVVPAGDYNIYGRSA